MKFFRLISILLVASIAPLPLASATPDKAGPPPLIDRDLIFGNPEIAAAQLSPDGRYIAFLKPWKDTRNIYVKAVGEPFSDARRLTVESKRPIAGFFWSRDSKYILYVKDNDGDENYNVYAVDPAAKPASGEETPASRDLTGLKGVRVILYEAPKSAPDVVYIGLNDRDKAWHDLYRLNLSTGTKELIRKNTERITGWVFDLKGQLRLATRSAENGDTEMLRVDPDSFTKIYSCNVFESCDPLHFQPGNQRIYMQTNKDADLISLVLFDPQSGKTEKVESDPLGKVDFGGALFSEKTDELIETWYTADRDKEYYKDKAFGEDVHWIEKKFPGEQYRTRPDPALRPQVAHADAAIQDLGKNPARRSGADEVGHLQIFRRPGNSRLPHAAERRCSEESANADDSSRRSLGSRPLGLQSFGAILRQSRLRGLDAELPRLDRLRQKISRCREPAVGPQNAG
jgi:hypothetical protein